MIDTVDVHAQRKARFRSETLALRYPRILRRTLIGVNDGAIIADIASLGRFLAGESPFVARTEGVDPVWQAFLARHDGAKADDIDFLDLEYLAFHTILEAHRYAERGVDPFGTDKNTDLPTAPASCAKLFETLATTEAALRASLVGNAHDASQLAISTSRTMLPSAALGAFESGAIRVDLICDNAGQEFIADLALAAYLLKTGTRDLRVHLKAVPWFVSDATLADAHKVFASLEQEAGLGPLAKILLDARDDGRLTFHADPLWTSPLNYGDGKLHAVIGDTHGPIILKGDLNYRRAVADAAVDVFTPWSDLAYRPDLPLTALRSVKSHCWIGMNRQDWPPQADPVDFPTDGSIFLAQLIPSASSPAAQG